MFRAKPASTFGASPSGGGLTFGTPTSATFGFGSNFGATSAPAFGATSSFNFGSATANAPQGIYVYY